MAQAVVYPWMMRSINQRFINTLDFNMIPNPSYLGLLLLTLVVFITNKVFDALVIVDNNPIQITILWSIGFLMTIPMVSLSLMIIGVPCGYINVLVDGLNDGFVEEEEMIHCIKKYKEYNRLSSSFLFVSYTGLAIKLTVSLYSLLYSVIGCEFQVNIFI